VTDELIARARDELYFRARTTQIQFAALAVRCETRGVFEQLPRIATLKRLLPATNLSIPEVRRGLANGWNTEFLLRVNRRSLTGDALRNSLQWAFPQAYYSVFAITSALFRTVGFTESSHAAVISKVGKQMQTGWYPDRVSFLADGGRRRIYANLHRTQLPSPLFFDRDQPGAIDTHIANFLNATREQDLKARKKGSGIKTKTGRPKKAFSASDWDRVSTRVGPTSILSLLYRKRIKANYRDIATFLSEDLQPQQLYADLITIVRSMNLVHEAYIAKMLGRDSYLSIQASCTSYDFLSIRTRAVLDII
jgi:hypothetical protein